MCKPSSGELFQKSLDNGSLDIKIASVVFVGMKDSTLSEAKHAVLQESISGTTVVSSLVEHEIYFRVEGDPMIRRLQAESCDNLVLHSMKETSKGVEQLFVERTSMTVEQEEISTTVEQKETSTTVEQKETSTTVEQKGTSTTLRHAYTENTNKQMPNPFPRPKQETPPSTITRLPTSTSQYKQSESFDQQPSESVSSPPLSQSQRESRELLDEAASFEDVVKLLKHSKNEGMVEFFHVFTVSSCHFMNEILQIFVKNLSLCALVIDSSDTIIHEREVELLREMSYASKTMVIEMCKVGKLSPENLASKSASLQHISSTLVESSSDPLNYIFPITLREQGGSDETYLLSHALSSSSTETFPFSWYLFGFRLRLFMTSNSQSTATVSDECMAIAKDLKMDRPTVEAALEHLMDHNIILYFRNILRGAVFLDVQIFFQILDSLFKKSIPRGDQHGSFDKSVFYEIIADLHNNGVSDNNMFTLFTELMIIAPFTNKGYFVPWWLTVLDEKDRKEVCSAALDFHVVPLFCKCPSTGYEFIVMLTAYILNRLDGWNILQTSQGHPDCLYKNCVMFNLEDHCVVTISFFSGYIEVYIKSERAVQNLRNISTTVLQGLEKVKLLMNSHQSFSFDMAFPCHCTGFKHIAPYNSNTGTLECDRRYVKIFPSSPIMKWLEDKPGMKKI
jgi:hypothetical protein